MSMIRPGRAVCALLTAMALVSACGGDDDSAQAEVASLGTDPPDDVATSSAMPSDSSDELDSTDVPTASAPTDPDDAALAYAECMREHGIDMPDPSADGEGRVMMAIEADEVDPDDFEAAQEECSPLMEAARSEVEIDPEREAELREEMLAYTECMREHGIDMPDPVFDDGGVSIQVGDPGEDGDRVQRVIDEDEEFQAANEACGSEGGPTIRAESS